MRKFKLFVIGAILLYIASLFIENISLFQITPCIILPWVVYISIKLEYRWCLTYTFIISLGNDLLNPQLLGFSTMLLVMISFLVYKFHTNFNKGKIYTVIISLLMINSVYFFSQWMYYSFRSPDPLFLFIKAVITIFYSTAISSIVISIIYVLDRVRISVYD